MSELQFIELFQRFGPLVGVVLFFIWRDWKREETLTKRIQILEEYNREVLVGLIKSTTSAIVANTALYRWVVTLVKLSPHGKDFPVPEELNGNH
jgi:hypothetical protein